MPEPPPEVISLIRFSNRIQVAEGKAGIEGQRQLNQITAKNNGVNIWQEVLLIDVPGSEVARNPQFIEMCKALEKRPSLIGIVVAEQSRASRPLTFDDWEVLSRLQKLGKLLITPTSRIDPNTPEGRIALTVGGMMSGEELHNMKARFRRGKKIKRQEGKHVNGNQALPRGFKFRKDRDAEGKVTGSHWEQDPIEMLRMQQTIPLVMANYPLQIIAKKTGGYGSGTALKRALQNPIWVGIRRYEWEATGTVYDPKPTAKNPTPKSRRRLIRRAVPIDVPTFEQLRAGTALPIVKPIMSLETWDALQANIAAREGIVRKTRAKNEDKTRFLAMGILFCSCGQMMYFRYGSNGRSHLDRYYCRSQYPHGPGCGAPSIRRNELDPTIERLISERMLNVKFLTKILEAATAQAPVPDPIRIGIEQARANLEAGRKDLLDMVRHHEITRKEFQEQIALLETELRQHQALLPAAPPSFNAREFLQGIANTFAVFSRLPFGAKREILSGAVKSIVADSRSRTIMSLTLSGGYLGWANEQLPSKTQLTIRPVPDLVFHLPEPFEIPDTYVDRRGGNGQHPNQIANRFRGRIQ